ncbi:response regulator [Spirochaetota bacterium]
MTKQKAILIVDDEAIIAISLKRELHEHFGKDYILETALNATDAESIIDELCEDGISIILIISDWLMPGVKGDEFLEKVLAKHPNIKSILLSGYVDDEAVKRLQERIRLDAFLRKPWNKAELIRTVEKCVMAAAC